ncbi:MAG TPA: hypothetical protein VJJ23_00365 [Candidatus Nanoarchaeia archaeon]|nr:hypothetical protein [Candidatus Nanoarchaeia archaeon]
MKISCYMCRTFKKCPIHSVEGLSRSINIKEIKELNSSSPPAVFVGSKLHYPSVNVGVLSPLEKESPWIYDAQSYWAANDFNINDIITLRSNLINSRFTTNVHEINKFTKIAQEIAMSVKPADIEVNLKKKIKVKISFDQTNLPIGPRGQLENIRLTSNTKIPDKIEKVFYDTDLKAVDAIAYLQESNFDERQISQLLSIGTLGLKKNRRLVPTRFSITAADDTLGKNLMENIKDYKLLEDYEMYYGCYLGNYYIILLIPELFSYELFETYLPSAYTAKPSTSTDYEDVFGRKTYASNTIGGYYAARLPILQNLNSKKRQASILVLRFITDEYHTPLGVFVCREATRKSISATPTIFASREDLLNITKQFILEKFKFDVEDLYKKSKLLKNLKTQSKLTRFF